MAINPDSSTAMYRRLEGKVAIITGGASGIGECTARLFAKHGARVVIADVQDDLGHSLSEELKSNGSVISYLHCDVTQESDVKNLVQTAISNHGKLDIMFSNAGVPGNSSDLTVVNKDGDVPNTDYENFRRVFDVNVFGAFLCAKHAARVMIPAKKGSIIITASVCSVTFGDVPYPYAASKNAVVGLAKNLGVELGQYGIRVNCISPYGVPTPMLMNALHLKDVGEAEEFVSGMANLKEVNVGTEDVAEAAVYLGSDESKYISGLNLVVDGGYSTTNIGLKGAKLAKSGAA